jgi:hypothetical protein
MMATLPSILPDTGSMLAPDADMEPAPFTFQSDLSDDDDDAEPQGGAVEAAEVVGEAVGEAVGEVVGEEATSNGNHAAADTTSTDPTTLNDIARASLAALSRSLSPLPKHDEIIPTTERHDQQKDQDMADARDETTPPGDDHHDESDVENGFDYDTPHDQEPAPEPRIVDVEVQLPWLPPDQRAEFEKMWVEEYHPDELDWSMSRKRRRVSTCCRVLCALA